MKSSDHFNTYGPAANRGEEEGLEWLRNALPRHAPYTVWALFTMGAGDGRRYEIDALVLTSHALYVTELKGWKGKVVDGSLNELVTYSDQRGRETVDHPLPMLTKKMHALRDRIRRVSRQINEHHTLDRLRFEELVWLTHAQGFDDNKLSEGAAARRNVIHGRHGIDDALRRAEFPGANPQLKNNAYARREQKALIRVLSAPEFGLVPRPRELLLREGGAKLGGVFEEGRGYQDRWTIEPNEHKARRRVRSYLLDKDDQATRERVQKRVQREASVLRKLGSHPDVLALDDYEPDGPHGPALVFRGFEGTTLDRFLRQQRNDKGESTLTTDDRLTIIERVAHALEFCHRNEIVHGALSPEAVLVRRLDSAAQSHDGRSNVEVKLTRFALASIDDASATSNDSRLLTRLGGSSAGAYEAPEVSRGARPDAASDLFSLGALAYYVFSEEAPAANAGSLQERLLRDDGLVLSAVRPDLGALPGGRSVSDVVFACTFVEPMERLAEIGSPRAFVESLTEALTSPDDDEEPRSDTAAELDPLQAERGDRLGELSVVSELGTGTTAKVLKVFKPERADLFFALKVPLSDEQNDRVAREGEVLGKLSDVPGLSNITRLVEPPLTLGGRTCLLMEFAGDRTLAEELREQGALSLDFARRWGEDLLLALRALESEGIQHRDIKPANIGLTTGASKQRKRLLVFDFSLSGADATNLEMGTPAYRDPGLVQRSHWDDAADRWAAAVTLYEMLAGTRPAPVPARQPDDVAMRIEAERFDASVRERLVGFFSRAFRLGHDKRFSTADDMRDAFIKALDKAAAETARELSADDIDLMGLSPGDGIQKLDLSPKAANALDRMGFYTLHDLSQLKPNWINAVPGVGRRTSRFLVELAARVDEYLERSNNEPPQPFFPNWAGEVVSLSSPQGEKLGEKLVETFAQSFIHDSAQLAAAPQSVVKNLVKRARAPVPLRDVTAFLKGLVDDSKPPATLRAAVHLFVPPPSGRKEPALEHFRIYVGLSSVEGCRPGAVDELAAHLGVSRQLLSIELEKFRGRWKRGGPTESVLRTLFDKVFVRLESFGGVAPISAVTDAVIDAFPPESDLAPDEIRTLAEALVRIVAEVNLADLNVPHGLRVVVKPRPGGVLVALDDEALKIADLLGAAADKGVDQGQVHVENAAAALLRTALGERSAELDARRLEYLLSIADRALLELAVVASENARLSVRGELYPRGLAPSKAVMLSAPALQGQLTVDEVKRRIRARYPEATELPDRTELDALLEPLRLAFNDTEGAFVPRLASVSSGATEALGSRTSRHRFRAVTRPENDAPGFNAKLTFNQLLDRASEDRRLRVLLWRGLAGDGRRNRTPDAVPVAKAVAKEVGGRHLSVDALLLEAAQAVALEKGMKAGLSPALKADAAGPGSAGWPRLVDLMALAADRVLARLLSETSPTVLTDLGLLARYGQLGFVEKLARAHRSGEANASTLVVLPVYAGEGAVVQVGLDVAESLGADPGTGLVPMKGPLKAEGEIEEVPAAWARERLRGSVEDFAGREAI